MEKNIFKNKDIENFIKSASEFITTKRGIETPIEIIKSMTSVFLSFNKIKSTSIYLLNDDSLEFEHKYTAPSNHLVYIKILFNKLLENGTIGKAIGTASPTSTFFLYDDDFPDSYYILPMMKRKGVNGLIIISINPADLDVFEENINHFFMFASLVGHTLENINLTNYYNKTLSLFEQKLAYKTINITQNIHELQAILNAVQSGIVVIDETSGIILNLNHIASDIIDIKIQDAIGQKCCNFNNFSFSNDIGEQNQSFESVIISRKNRCVPVLRQTSYIHVGNQKLRIESFVDISERKNLENFLKEANDKLEQKVRERTEELEQSISHLKIEISEREKAEKEIIKILDREKELNELKTRFVSMVSHEFRTPLTLIRTAAQMVSRFKHKLNDNDRDDYLKKIIKTVDSMTEILENVIFIGKTDSIEFDIHPVDIDLVKECKNIIDDVKIAFKSNHYIKFRHSLNSKMAYLDEKLLRHILINLLSNAIKYAPETQPVELEVEEKKNGYVFIVRDYGIGIPENEQKRIFDLFHRAGNVGAVSGTGLGLSVVQRSLEAFNGTIDIKSKENEGTTVIIKIPFINQSS